MARRVVVAGATGLIGRHLCAYLHERGNEVIALVRNVEKAKRQILTATAYVHWQPSEHSAWAESLDGADALVNLAGASIFGKRWDAAYKNEIRDSRVVSTRVLFSALIAARRKPAVFINGSAIGYYGPRDATPLDEQSPPGNDFLAQVGVAWEQEALEAEELGIRTVLLRTGIVLDHDDGALPKMMLPFQLLSGGPILPGNQWLSWIHIADEIGLIALALDDERVTGPLNATAPEPQTNRDFMATLGRVMGRPSWLPTPGFGLHLLLGEVADLLVQGQRVLPRKAQSYDYQFRYPTAEAALRDLLVH
ncbi:MAG: TIGR01777 family protein [Chloroflexaceae bacterium]|nr:TIGR01777 family protein [Chloroflexaceae bacterium]